MVSAALISIWSKVLILVLTDDYICFRCLLNDYEFIENFFLFISSILVKDTSVQIMLLILVLFIVRFNFMI